VERVGRERGTDKGEPPESRPITLNEMMDVLRHEVPNITKGAELRIRELTTLATDYAKGDATPEEATARFLRYKERWHDTLSSMASVDGRTDEHILREIDEVHPEFTFPRPYAPNAGKAKGRPR
jgi:hypothetical protein